MAVEYIEFAKKNKGIPFYKDYGKGNEEVAEEVIAPILSKYQDEFWIVNLMEAQLFVFTYSEYRSMPAVTLDRIKFISQEKQEYGAE